ncbi:hypothetical protein BKA80DRAFT_29368 [Phyllosticta citrichinensis]
MHIYLFIAYNASRPNSPRPARAFPSPPPLRTPSSLQSHARKAIGQVFLDSMHFDSTHRLPTRVFSCLLPHSPIITIIPRLSPPTTTTTTTTRLSSSPHAIRKATRTPPGQRGNKKRSKSLKTGEKKKSETQKRKRPPAQLSLMRRSMPCIHACVRACERAFPCPSWPCDAMPLAHPSIRLR